MGINKLVRVRRSKSVYFRNALKLSCYQLKIGCYNFTKLYVSLIVSLMVTTREKHAVIM